MFKLFSRSILVGLFVLPSSGFAQEANEIWPRDDSTKVICDFPLPTEEDKLRAMSLGAGIAMLPAPLEETFLLHSNPDATKVIYLDFDGYTLSWEGDEFVYDPWNFEGNENSFSDKERTVIQLIWKSVSEDFLPFDVNVTTEFPGQEALKNSGGDDTEWGIRAVINHSHSSSSWAYVGSFSDPGLNYLYATTGNFPDMWMTWLWAADSLSHEAGHALGLSHDGDNSGTEYYPGYGTGPTMWAPIMGWTNKGLGQWSKGEYTDANNQEDDLNIITTQNGFGYRADDHGSTTATATAVDVEASVVAEGIIEQSDDVDFFTFTVKSDGYHLITVKPDQLNPNLDISANLYGESIVALYASNPLTTLKAEFDVFLTAGDYYLSVEGTGYDDPDSDGYSDYGSLGYYSIHTNYEESITGETDDTGELVVIDDTSETGEVDNGHKGNQDANNGSSCGCSTGSSIWPGSMLLLILAVVRRRQRNPLFE